MNRPTLAPNSPAPPPHRTAVARTRRSRLFTLALVAAMPALGGCNDSTRPLLLAGEYTMVSYGGQALPAQTGVRVKANPATGYSTTCADTVRSAAIVLEGAGSARWRWDGETRCAGESGSQMTSVDLEASYTVSASELVLEVYPLVAGPTMPPEPVEPLVLALRREGADLLVLESPIVDGTPVLQADPSPVEATSAPENTFRIVWRRTR